MKDIKVEITIDDVKHELSIDGALVDFALDKPAFIAGEVAEFLYEAIKE